MSLDVWLTKQKPEPMTAVCAAQLLREHGFEQFAADIESRQEASGECLYEANITHNLTRMAEAAGIYKHLWRPEEIGITKAEQLIAPLTEGLAKLQANPVHYAQFNASNGWGLYEQFVPWVSRYLEACQEFPNADVCVSR